MQKELITCTQRDDATKAERRKCVPGFECGRSAGSCSRRSKMKKAAGCGKIHTAFYMGNRMQMRSNCVLIGIKQGQVVQCKQKG
jgi:hypothetical protein